MRYFAYGSNMNWRQMQLRCPTSKFVTVAELRRHRLHFPRRSDTRMCGVASFTRDDNRSVWGVVYEVSDLDLNELDRNEGYNTLRSSDRNSYNRVEVEVHERDEGFPLSRALTYVAVAQAGNHLPNKAYMKTIIEGARKWDLPESYIAELATMPIID